MSVRVLENADLKRMMSTAASMLRLWHDLEPNMQDEQFLARAYGKSDSLFPDKFCYILRAYLGKKSVIYVRNMFTERSDYTQQ